MSVVSNTLESEYLSSLSEKERMGYEIAKNHLGSTFHLQKSNGFIAWKKDMEEKKRAEVAVATTTGDPAALAVAKVSP
jgi:hypothetical protein